MLTVSQINDILHIDIKSDKNTKKIYNSINEFYEYNTCFDKCSLIIGIIYLNRYNNNAKITNKNIKDLIESCLILSNKFISDNEILGCGPLESEILEKIKWNLFINKEEYDKFEKLIPLHFHQ
jgi:hypothetical protein